MIRLFAAVPIPDAVAAALAPRQTGVTGARWRPRESLHITLRFFGDVREDMARDLDAELLRLRAEPFEIVLAGAGAFGEGPDLHAVWAGVAENEPLRRLAKACETAARRVGLAPDKRVYRPHVTLAYLRHPDPVEVAGWIQANSLLASPAFPVDHVAIYSSTLGRAGSHYRLEAAYPLSA